MRAFSVTRHAETGFKKVRPAVLIFEHKHCRPDHLHRVNAMLSEFFELYTLDKENTVGFFRERV